MQGHLSASRTVTHRPSGAPHTAPHAPVGGTAIVGVLALALLAAPRLARAQAEPGAPERPHAAPPGDDARIRELVDREVTRILTERAVKEAAEQAAKETTDREAAQSDEPGDVKGASGFMDTRLAFTLTNENLLVKPGETIPSVPGWRFGTPSSLGVLFFDNYDTRYSGFETLSHAVMYREYSRGHLQAEGALVLRIDDLAETRIGLSDDGSYVTISNWKDPTHRDPTRISLTVFPVGADRFRLGYSYRLSWGGSPEYRQSDSKPGIKLQYEGPSGYVFAGAKSGVIDDPRIGAQRSALAALAGAGFDATSMLRLEANAGYFDRGYNPAPGAPREKVRLYGASVQASIHHGMPVGSSLDYRLYKFNGESVSGLFAPERYPGGVSWLAQSELTLLSQTLADGMGTATQRGMAGDLNVRMKIERFRLRLDASYRDLAFVLHSEPSLPAYQVFPAGSTTQADYFAALGVDHNWGDWLTLGVIGGFERPASLTSPSGLPDAPEGSTTAVVRSNNVDTLVTYQPPGEGAADQIAVKGTAKLDFAKIFSVLVEVFYSRDANQVRYRPTCAEAGCPVTSEFAPFHQLGLNATLQARF